MVQFLTRPGCHICDDARPVVITAVTRAGGAVHEVDIESDDSLLGRFGLQIPVVLAGDGSIVAEGAITTRELRRALRRLR